MAKLLVSIPSRDFARPEGISGPNCLSNTIKMLYQTCRRRENFDVIAVVDNDQAEMYREVLEKYPEVHPIFIEHEEHWRNISISIFQYMLSHPEYYFLFPIADDVGTYSPNWDAEILSKLGMFPDDLFLLYSACTIWGRKQNIKQSAYVPPRKFSNFQTIIHFHEHMPILTYKWVEFLLQLFIQENPYIGGHALLCAAMVQQLNLLYRVNRHVPTTVDCSNFLIPTRLTDSKSGVIVETFYGRQFSDISPIVDQMFAYIKSKATGVIRSMNVTFETQVRSRRVVVRNPKNRPSPPVLRRNFRNRRTR